MIAPPQKHALTLVILGHLSNKFDGTRLREVHDLKQVSKF
jgi:hypothetical protein